MGVSYERRKLRVGHSLKRASLLEEKTRERPEGKRSRCGFASTEKAGTPRGQSAVTSQKISLQADTISSSQEHYIRAYTTRQLHVHSQLALIAFLIFMRNHSIHK